MLNIYRLDHIGQVVADLDAQVSLLQGLFGFRPSRSWENADEGCRGVMLDIPGSWGHRWEVLAPLGDNSPLQAFLDSPRGPGVHHVAVEVPDMAVAVEQMEELGINAQRRSAHPEGKWIDMPFVPPELETGLLLRVFGPPVGSVCGRDKSRPIEPSSESAGPSLGIVAVEQVGQAYQDRDKLAQWCARALGMREVYRTPEGKHPDIATMVLTLSGTHIRWEIISPVDENSFVQRFLDKRGAGAHHVTFEVRDWAEALAACEKHEIPTFGENSGETDGARWSDTFIHPRYTGGILVQFFWEEKPGVWSRSDKVPGKPAARAGASG